MRFARRLLLLAGATDALHAGLRPCRASARQSGSTVVMMEPINTAVVVAAGASVLIGGQAVISAAYEGDQGLKQFLADGSQFAGSSYRPRRKDDPQPTGGFLSGLKLPKLQFVEVYGDDATGEEDPSDDDIARAEALQAELRRALDSGDVDAARTVQYKLEAHLERAGIAFDPDRGEY